MDNYTEVFVKEDNSESIEITPQYVYLTVPSEYVCVYHKLLSCIADFGKEILDNCEASCKGIGKSIINCWNLFQSAIACKELGRDDEANLFIDYINKQLFIIYRGTNKDIYKGTFPVTITDTGGLKAMVTCGSNTKFEVDPDTGILYQKWLDSKDSNKVYSINDNGELEGKIKD